MSPRGRPPAEAGQSASKKAKIAKVAAKSFAKVGYEKTTIRLVAEAAEVDPKLVMHYFGNKESLFVSTLKTPFNPKVLVASLRLLPRTSWGARIAEIFFSEVGSKSPQRTLTGVIRAAVSEPAAAEMFKKFYVEQILVPLLSGLDIDNPVQRAVAVSSVMTGYVFSSQIIDLQSLTGTNLANRKKLLGQLIQVALTGPLD